VEVDRRGPGFSRLTVETVDGRQVAVEIAHDARLRASVQLDFGRLLHPDEVAADKTLALFGRAAARDLVDVAALIDRYPLQQLCALAEGKDSGFSPSVLADAMNAAAAHPNHAFAELGLSDEATSRLKQGPGMARRPARDQHREPAAAVPGPTTSDPSPASRA
jgi:hypothetical protein